MDSFFKISERGSTVSTEVRAGVASFLTMSYNLLVNPQILSLCGIPSEDVVVATAGASAFASILVGLFGNLPFGMAPGMGLSAYLTFGLVVSGTLTRAQALTCCFIAGVLLIISTITGLSHFLMKLTPHHIKLAIVVGMGLLVALIGMVSVGLVVASGDASLVALGDLGDWRIWMTLGGLMMVGTLTYHQVEGGILMAISTLTVLYWAITGGWPAKVVELPVMRSSVTDNIDLTSLDTSCILPTLAFLFVALFDVSGVMFGLASLAKIQEPDGAVPKGVWGFLGSALGTAMAAAMGCSPIIVQVENAAGIKEGGRTGLTAVVVGLLFLVSLFLAPLFGAVPTCATAPVLILVGAMMCNESKNVDWNNMKQALPAFLTIAMMPFTYSIPNGILFGMAASFLFFFTSGEFLDYCLPSRKQKKQGYETINGTDEENNREFSPMQSKTMSFIDDRDLVRHPSLLLSKDEADEHESAAKAVASPAPEKKGPRPKPNGTSIVTGTR